MFRRKRRGRSVRLPIPFLKIKINAKTGASIIGFIFVGFGLLLILSFLQSGAVLQTVNTKLVEWLGGVSLFFPLLILLWGTHFFNSKKLKIVKPHISGGLTLIFISLAGVLQSGRLGNIIYENLALDFSLLGALIILSITFIIGLILFLNTSIDVFFLFIWRGVKGVMELVKKHGVTGAAQKQDKKMDLKKNTVPSPEFIKDERTAPPPLFQKPVTPAKPATPTLSIKSLSKESQTAWVYPPHTLITDVPQGAADRGDVKKNSDIIERTLESFGVRAEVQEVNSGPTVTQYALAITRGTKLSKITALGNDLALALAASTGQVRIEAPIPGRSLVGIEIPNKKSEVVSLRRLLEAPIIQGNTDSLMVPLGLDVSGLPQWVSISRMPHVLIAGTTGSGKSVLLNSWICSFLFRAKPEDLRLILVDPKRVELNLYNGIPHLLTEVIVDSDKIINALKWTVAEMENRYKLFAQHSVRNIESFNKLPDVEKVPNIVFVIDELADLMIFAPAEAEEAITRIAQKARATGIHLILATQRPSVDVITGLMKANIPTRIAFNVSSMIDSRVVLDMPGAEKLLGKGDMLYLPPDQAKPRRIQGPFILEKEVIDVVSFLKKQVPEVHYTEEVTNQDTTSAGMIGGRGTSGGSSGLDSKFNEALEIVSQSGKASASLFQRRLSIGYARAAKILDQLEAEGYVGPASGSKPRDVLSRRSETQIEESIVQE